MNLMNPLTSLTRNSVAVLVACGLAISAILAASFFISPAVANATADKVKLCHHTSSEENPWNAIEVNASALQTHEDHHLDFEYTTGSGEFSDEWCEENAPLSGSISGIKFNDLDGDGESREEGEPILSGWTIRLYELDEPWELFDSSVTDDDGEYSFEDLPEGTYKVCEVMQEGWEQTFTSYTATNESPSVSEEGPVCQTVEINEDGEENTRNFGNYYEEPYVDFCDPSQKPGGKSIAQWHEENNFDGSSCFSYEVAQQCGSLDVSFTENQTPYSYAFYYALGSETPELANWEGDGPLPVSFDEDYNGGSVDVTYYVVGAESDYFTGSSVPNIWDGNGTTVSVDTDCEAPAPQQCSVTIVSDTTNTVVEKDNASAVLLSFIHTAWTAAISGASWIWGDDPVQPPVNGVVQTFEKTFEWSGPVASAVLEVAADNSYAVTLNGTNVGGDAGEFNYNLAGQDSYDVSSLVEEGVNTLSIQVTNKPGSDNPASNPAGLLYSLTVVSTDTGTDCQTAPEVNQCVPEPEGGWADTVVDANQGLTKNGGAVAANRSNTDDVLDAADWTTGGSTGFYSLGFGGWITVMFDSYVPNVEGNDISIHEATNGSYPAETALIEVSQDGDAWYEVGTADNDGVSYFDFDSTGFDWIKYVRITDTTNPAIHGSTADGFDLDAIDATETVCEEPIIVQCELGVNLLVNGSFESPLVTHGSNWDIFPSGTEGLGWIVEWLTGSESAPEIANIELQKNGLFSGSASDGYQWTELDSDWNGHEAGPNNEEGAVAISQTVLTAVGETYTFSFDFSPRPNTDASQNKVEFLVNGVSQGFVGPLAGSGSISWTAHEFSFVADTLLTTVTLRYAGTSNDSIGTLIDNAALMCEAPVAMLTIVKYTDEGDGEFTFSVTGTGFSASPSVETEEGEGQSQTLQLAPGTYDVTEVVPEGWYLDESYCTYGGESEGESIEYGHEITVADGDNVTCYFYNEHEEDLPELTIVKYSYNGESLVDGSFDFEVSDPSDVFGYDASPTIETTDGSGETTLILPGEGTFNVLEVLGEGWALSDVWCEYAPESPIGSSINDGQGYEITVEDGDQITCYFENYTDCGQGFYYDEEAQQCDALDGQVMFDIAVDKTVEHDGTPAVGETVVYTITAKNEGTYTTNEFTITDLIPAGVTYVSHNASSGTYTSGTGAWELSSIGSGITVTLTITATINSGEEEQTITNTATLTDDGENGTDTNSENNSDSASFTVEEDDEEEGGGGDGPSNPTPQTFLGGGITGLGGGNGFVLGASTEALGESCGLYMDRFLRYGYPGNNAEQVEKLQQFLNKHGFGALNITGIFGLDTENAVKKFQQTYANEILTPWGLNAPTGLVYITTLRQINLIECPQLSLQVPELVAWSLANGSSVADSLTGNGTQSNGGNTGGSDDSDSENNQDQAASVGGAVKGQGFWNRVWNFLFNR